MRLFKQASISLIGLVIFMLIAPAQLMCKVWERYILRHGTPIEWSFMRQVYAQVLSTVEEALKSFMPEALEFREEKKRLSKEQQEAIAERSGVKLDPIFDRRFKFYIGINNGRVVGYAIKDVVRGKWGPIHYMLSIDANGSISDVIVLEYSERRGRPVASRRFLRQFIGKTIKDNIRLKKDIRGVTGATLSSRSMNNGIKKLLHVFNELYANELYAYKQQNAS